MNRRQFMRDSTIGAAALAIPAFPAPGVGRQRVSPPSQRAEVVFRVNPKTGDDANDGARATPLRTLAEAARRASRSEGAGPITILLSEGIHSIAEEAVFRPERRSLSRADRLTIRADVLPDDPAWHWGRMPTLIHAIPLEPTWNGRPDPLGGAVNGMLIEASHVSILGLRILGLPVVESPIAGQIRRLYAVSRLRDQLEDLEVAHCVFAGDHVIAPNHVGIIARGNGLVVHHCIFRGLKISAVYWSGGSRGHAMHHCVLDDQYGSAVWTSGIADDFDYRNNVVTNSNYVWTWQGAASARADAGGQRTESPSGVRATNRYRVLDSYLGGNRRLAGTGTGARLEYTDIDPSFLDLVGTTVSDQPVPIEKDQSNRWYLHPEAGTPAAATGAGLFTSATK
jgi:hypothetical protein